MASYSTNKDCTSISPRALLGLERLLGVQGAVGYWVVRGLFHLFRGFTVANQAEGQEKVHCRTHKAHYGYHQVVQIPRIERNRPQKAQKHRFPEEIL